MTKLDCPKDIIDIITTRIMQRLRTKNNKGYPYQYLLPCAQDILHMAMYTFSNQPRYFETKYHIVVLQPLQIFVAGRQGLNTVMCKQYTRQAYRDAINQLTADNWIRQTTDVPTFNQTTGSTIIRTRIGCIVDLSIWLDSKDQSRYKLVSAKSEIHNYNHIAKETTTMHVVANQSILPNNTIKSRTTINQGENTYITKRPTNLVATNFGGISKIVMNQTNNQDGYKATTKGDKLGNAINTAQTGDMHISSNHYLETCPTKDETKKSCCLPVQYISEDIECDDIGNPICPECGQPLEYNHKFGFWGHPDYRHGVCHKTYGNDGLRRCWQAQKREEKEKQQYKKSIAIAEAKMLQKLKDDAGQLKSRIK